MTSRAFNKEAFSKIFKMLNPVSMNYSTELTASRYWYDVLDDYDEGYLICNIPECTKKRFRPSEMTVILKENLEDDVYVVTGKSEEFKEGGGAI